MKNYMIKRQAYGYEIQACITKMPKDIHILLTGGNLPHIGAVSIFEEGREKVFVQLPEHKDGVVSQRWAKELSKLLNRQVTVNCGIHYDDLTKDQIEELVKLTEEMLKEAIKILQ
ncbi:MAG: hypothetical protein H9872_02445 [Candidatus Cellulosilyticum pullistercoris]|uniref:Prenylated flavin chaperone LpdD-like domain-containing protein n=1 Tax=Candidatus Cellulosilyticum pullistercoris TaxID=2838521 RepID=A0A9E2KBU1_9FIRM|nr:hypothetical protein [Candidatus Cellulosilyticum pullistercoris]